VVKGSEVEDAVVEEDHVTVEEEEDAVAEEEGAEDKRILDLMVMITRFLQMLERIIRSFLTKRLTACLLRGCKQR
jgi:hypothetical protein